MSFLNPGGCAFAVARARFACAAPRRFRVRLIHARRGFGGAGQPPGRAHLLEERGRRRRSKHGFPREPLLKWRVRRAAQGGVCRGVRAPQQAIRAPPFQRDCTDHVATLGVRTPSIRTVPRIRVGRCPAHGSARVRRVRVVLADSRERPRRAARRGDAFSTD